MNTPFSRLVRLTRRLGILVMAMVPWGLVADPGDLDTTFGIGGSVITYSSIMDNPYSPAAYALAEDAEGNVYVGGSNRFILKYDATGALDSAFGVDGRALATMKNVNDIVALDSGKLLVVGKVARGMVVMRLNADGSRDATFGDDGLVQVGSSMTGSAEAIAVQSDGKILVSGILDTGTPDFALARLNEDGTLDANFGTEGLVIHDLSGGSDTLNAMVLQSDGAIVLAGYTGGSIAVVRYDADGVPDTGFGGTETGVVSPSVNGLDQIDAAVVAPDDSLFLAGYTNDGVQNNALLMKLTPDGLVDTDFGTDGIVQTDLEDTNYITALGIDGSGTLWAIGDLLTTTNGFDVLILSYDSQGNPNTSFSDDGYLTVSSDDYAIYSGALLVADDGDVFVGFRPISGNGLSVSRYNPDGTLDTAFSEDGQVEDVVAPVDADVVAHSITEDDGILIADSGADSGIGWVKLTADGALDPTFGDQGRQYVELGRDVYIQTILQQDDGGLLTGGNDYDTYNIVVMRFDAEGQLDPDYGTAGLSETPLLNYYEGHALPMLAQGDQAIVGGSYYDSDAGHEYGALARLDANGDLDPSFGDAGVVLFDIDGSSYAQVLALAEDDDGNLLVTGEGWNNASTSPFTFLARFTSSGVLDSTFGSDGAVAVVSDSVEWEIHGITPHSGDKILLTGTWEDSSGNEYAAALRYTSAGVLDTTFGTDGLALSPYSSDRAQVTGVRVLADDSIVLAGYQDEGFNQAVLHRFTAEGAVDASFGDNGRVVQQVGSSTGRFGPLGVQSDGSLIVSGRVSDGLEDLVSVTRFDSGPAALTLSDTALAFPDTDNGSSSASESLMLSNTGTEALTISTVAITGSFSAGDDCTLIVLNPGDQCSLAVTFSPTEVGAVSGSLTVTSDLGDDTVSLTGTGLDSDAPIISAPDDITVDAVDASGSPSTDEAIASFLSAATADDDTDADPVVTHDAPATFPLGSTTVTFSATDAAGNTGTETRTVTVIDQDAPVITLTGATLVTLTYGDDFTDPGATASDNVDGDISTDITITGSVELDRVGDYNLSYDVSDSAGNAAATQTRSVSIVKADQTITFDALPDAVYGDADTPLNVSADSGLDVTMVATPADVCTLDGEAVSIVGVGECTVTASQPGTDNYNAAADVTRPFTVAKADQTLTFNALADKTMGDADFAVSATSDAGLDVSFASTTPSVCAVSDTTVTVLSYGTCSITASQSGNAYYNAASVTRSFTVQDVDSDGDGLVDHEDTYPNDYDNDGVDDSEDAFPEDPTETVDTDNDGIGDNADTYPNDYDNDGVDDSEDAFPEDPTETVDTDNDGIGDNADAYPNDYDNDGVDDADDAFPEDATGSTAADDVDVDDNGLIEIATLAELDAIRDDLTGASLSGITAGCPDTGCIGFELTADLDFDTNGDGVINVDDDYWNDGLGWEPLGDYESTVFTAVFDGNGHALRNLMIHRPNQDYVGLFGYIEGATVNRLSIQGAATSITGYRYVGGLVGRAVSESTVSGIAVSASVSGESQVGGLVGEGDSLTLQGSYSIGTVTGGAYLGGLAGVLYTSTVNDAFALTSVSGLTTGVGGLVGSTTFTSYTDTRASGAVTGSNLVGGLLGESSGVTLSRSYASGSVTGSGDDVGGLVGFDSASTVTTAYWDPDTSGQSTSALGTGFTTAELQCPQQPADAECTTELYGDWDDSRWDFGTDDEYPALYVDGVPSRDSDADGVWDFDDAFPDNTAASLDADVDGQPDAWNPGCDSECQTDSGLTLDADPSTPDNDEGDSNEDDGSGSTDGGEAATDDTGSDDASSEGSRGGALGTVALLMLVLLFGWRREGRVRARP